mmetsp:Transcript_5659/g.8382  ORF Transcript_5659/g.8382 Transcript_5659/m.8382 type:complete len:95 (+) Transcript_5659:77-361(+)
MVQAIPYIVAVCVLLVNDVELFDVTVRSFIRMENYLLVVVIISRCNEFLLSSNQTVLHLGGVEDIRSGSSKSFNIFVYLSKRKRRKEIYAEKSS